MNEQTAYQLKLALLNAQTALKQQNKVEARRWALAAANIAPENEEVWLILAAVSNPTASISYLQHALKLNPSSERAAKGMQWALKRLAASPTDTTPQVRNNKENTKPTNLKTQNQLKVSNLVVTPPFSKPEPVSSTNEDVVSSFRTEPVSPAPIKQEKVKTSKQSSKSKGRSWAGTLIITLILLCAAAVVWAAMPGWIALARSSSAPIPANVLEKPTLTPTLTPSPTPTATFTPPPKPTKTPAPTSTPIPPTPVYTQDSNPVVDAGDRSGRWIDIDLSAQTLYAYNGDTLIDSFLVSTGTSAHPTVTGQYHIYVKYRYTAMSGPGYYLPDVPYTMYFYSGYGVHGTYWHHNFGIPMSHGCVNMETSEAEWLFGWASIGTLVNIHY